MLVGSDSTGEASVYFNRLTSSLAGEATISGTWPVAPAAATGGISVIRPAEVKGSFPSFRDGRRLFWRGATARLSDKLLPVNDESIVKQEFYSRVLEPTNAPSAAFGSRLWVGAPPALRSQWCPSAAVERPTSCAAPPVAPVSLHVDVNNGVPVIAS